VGLSYNHFPGIIVADLRIPNHGVMTITHNVLTIAYMCIYRSKPENNWKVTAKYGPVTFLGFGNLEI
jgi:hypothetical protein